MNGTAQPSHGSAAGGGETPTLPASVDEWLAALASVPGELGALLRPSWTEQLEHGYGHTLREIGQQPLTWLETTSRMRELAPVVAPSLDGAAAVVMTGSGSSVYAGECVAPCLQQALGVPVSAVPTGLILTHPEACLPPSGPFLVVSLARSGNSPESRAAVDWLLESRPQARHLFITCNSRGALATSYRERTGGARRRPRREDERPEPRDDEQLHEPGAGRARPGLGPRPGLVRGASPRPRPGRRRAAARAGDALAAVGRSGFGSVVYLGSGCRLGSAREAALKMLEMNAGDVWTLAESYLGLRHGPMSALRPDTLVVAFLSSDPMVRAYEADLLQELDRKGLGTRRVVFGDGLPTGLSPTRDTVLVDCTACAACRDEDLTVLDALVGQLLAFFRCLAAGYRPDSPSETSVITRVVSGFEIHRRNGAR